ncbi:MAG: gamma-glutamyltransferase family protein [Betaproteobacteria bacterium]|nr:gamma-glutamyltransferase family protein [Betaproteobacteria bacterium]
MTLLTAATNRALAPAASYRPTVMGRKYAVACGHYLAAQAAMRVLDAGGNVVDAGVTAAIALAVLQPDIVGFGGVAPTLVHRRSDRQTFGVPGLGWWPALTDVDRLREEGKGTVPEGILRSVMPAAPATHIETLRRFGTISFEQAVTPAMEIASHGFAVFPVLANSMKKNEAGYRRWADNARIFLPQGRAPRIGEILVQTDLARTFGRMIEAERGAPGNRDAKLAAVHDFFYRGPIAREIDAYHRANDGFIRLDDLARFTTPIEAAIAARYRAYSIENCDVWCQGIALLESMRIAEGFDPQSLGHNSADYVHLMTETMNLAFADREAYLGDPKFVSVPTDALLSDAYALAQRERIDHAKAFGAMPAAGVHGGRPKPYAGRMAHGASTAPTPMAPDTIYCCVMDSEGNTYSATLSDNSYDSPVIPGTGMTISSRGCQSRLEAGHPSEVKPGKRPRLTPSPAIALRDGVPFMGFGTPGGDVQTQAMMQVFFNIVEFKMTVQQAVEAPRFSTASFPNSFSPHQYLPGRLNMESAMPAAVIEAMLARGHDVEVWPAFPAASGAVCAVMQDPVTGWLHAGADPRREAYAMGW